MWKTQREVPSAISKSCVVRDKGECRNNIITLFWFQSVKYHETFTIMCIKYFYYDHDFDYLPEKYQASWILLRNQATMLFEKNILDCPDIYEMICDTYSRKTIKQRLTQTYYSPA